MYFREKTGSFAGSNGVNIFYRHYTAATERGRLVIAHGLGEHSGRYGNVIGHLLLKGISVRALDHRGHGQSEGKRGHTLNFMQYPTDLHAMLELARGGISGGRKCFLINSNCRTKLCMFMTNCIMKFSTK